MIPLKEDLNRSLQIRPHTCYNSMGDIGTCMFVWECIKTEGKHLGTCADGFLFGSCCAHNDSKNNLIPQSSTVTVNYPSDKTTSSSVSYSETISFDHKVIIFEARTHSRPPPKTSRRPTTTITTRTPTSKTPVTHLTSNTTSLVTIANFLTHSTTLSSVVTVQKPSLPSNNTGYIPSNITINGWFRPTAITSLYASTKGPQYSTKTTTTRRPQATHKPYTSTKGPQYSTKSTTTTRRPHATHKPYTSTKQPHHPSKATTSRRPHTTQRTTKYPYVQPSWKPRPTSSTTTKPHLFTFSNYYSTPKTTQVTKVSTPSSFQNVTTSSNPITTRTTTQKISTTNKPSVSTSRKPIFSTTERTPVSSDTTTHKTLNVSMIPFFTTFRPGGQVPTTYSPLNWFTPSPTKLPINFGKYNTTVVNGSVLIESTTPSIVKPSTSIKPTAKPTGGVFPTLKPVTLTAVDKHSTTPSTKPTSFPVSSCGVQAPHPQKKVVGGTNSAFGSWPWQASVRRTSFFGFSSTHRCGGALISHQWVATAGHCVDDLLLSQIKIRVGEYDFASAQEPHGYVERGAKKKVVHPRYNFFTYENDLALVQLEEAIDSDKYPHISPICLPPFEENLVGKNATVTGWGRLSEGGVLPSILQEVQVPIISNEKCKNMFLAAGRHEYIPDIFMCAGFEEGGRDSCQGDSGGPLQIQADEGYWFLAGIISWGIGCAEPNMPGVCTRISKFKDWVVQQIRQNSE
ncbi:serine proteinase stubble [Caerostris darwini]|uniref:Serine proteinase stubble n=1 Tax=Caerostris darwini TaxID=1538125 RepID=A0AAV4TXG6_9ARAC|nr:serine proteinase stubble [Caerostris darwini]